jgi:RNA polymerase sigma factor (sigma-70 family)
MTASALYHVLRHYSRSVADSADADLLARFARQRDEAAFAEILHRHGPMVQAVCRRFLGATADADDAFQGTFLVLIRKAATIQAADLLGHWLCAVAYRVARQALRRRQRTGLREQQVERLPEPGYEQAPPRDWLPGFDAELERLPAKFREPLLLCELLGQSRADAARLLGLNENTLSSRLARGRALLRRRMGRLGFPMALGGIMAPVAVAEALAQSTLQLMTQAATRAPIPETIRQLMNGVMPTMTAAKLKCASIVLIFGLLIAGICMRWAARPAEAAPAEPPSVAKTPAEPTKQQTDRERLQGKWKFVWIAGNGPPTHARDWEPLRARIWSFDKEGCKVAIPNYGTDIVKNPDGSFDLGFDVYGGEFALEANANPHRIDIILPGNPKHPMRCGIYKWDGDRLEIWFGPDGDPKNRPKRFRIPKEGANFSVMKLERQKD